MAEQRLSVLLAHLAPQHPAAHQPGSRGDSMPWTITSNGPMVIVGGVCLDIQAQPLDVDVQRGTSVPGRVRQVPGGVGRNMAEALSQLAPPHQPAPVFVSLVGDDTAGAFLTAALRRLRLDLSHLLTLPGVATPCVAAVLDRCGEVAAAVADVAAVEAHLTPERLAAECGAQLQRACMVLAEANLSAQALEYVGRAAAAARVPLFLEPVSVPKAARLLPALPYATFISPNAAELIAIADAVRHAAGLPPLPRPSLPEGEEQAEGQEQAGGGGGGADDDFVGGEGAGEAEADVVRLLRQLAAFAEVVLLQGTAHVVLTLGSLGAALVSLRAAPAPAAATPPHDAPPPGLQLDACAAGLLGCSGGGGCSGCSGGGCRCCSGGGGRCCSGCGGAALPAPLPAGGSVASPAPPAGGGLHPGHGRGRGARWQLSRSVTSGPGAGAGPAGQGQGEQPAAAGLPPGLPPPPHPPGRAVAVEVVHLRALPAEVVSVNGAGDTLVAGMVGALLHGHGPEAALALGMAAATRAVESHSNVPALEWGALRAGAAAVAATRRRHVFPAAC